VLPARSWAIFSAKSWNVGCAMALLNDLWELDVFGFTRDDINKIQKALIKVASWA
jgi:hypothetical protein